MKKFILAALVSLAFFPTIAKSGAKPGNVNDYSGIVTPDVAVSVRRFESYTISIHGDTVVCMGDYSGRSNTCETSTGPNNGWVPLAHAVPKGKTYVGFRVVSGAYGYRQIEIYWK
jgi:hypothetical protein